MSLKVKTALRRLEVSTKKRSRIKQNDSFEMLNDEVTAKLTRRENYVTLDAKGNIISVTGNVKGNIGDNIYTEKE